MIWQAWWLWAIAALVLGFLELLAPTQILLGFAIGAGVVSGILLVGGPFGASVAGSLPTLLLLFAVVSLVAWLVLRPMMGVRKGQVKHWDRDINED
jgi:membrane protein implicated in regulation of membrane protease activity